MDDAINIDVTSIADCLALRQSIRKSLRISTIVIVGLIFTACQTRPVASQSQPSGGPLLSAQRILLPTSGAAPAGFRIEIRHERLTQFGDLPMRVLVTPTNATFQEDRELTLRVTFDPKSVTPSGFATSYQIAVKVDAGTSLVDRTFYLPKWFLRGDIRLSILESGQQLAGYTDTQTATWYDNSNEPYDADWLESIWMDSAVARFGWIASPGSQPLELVSQGSELDDVRVLLLSLIPEVSFAEDLSNVANLPSVLKNYGELAGFRYRTIGELPKQWQGMQQCHVWIADWATWESIESNHPEIALAMRQYVRCGGALWLVNAPPIDQVAERFNVLQRPAGEKSRSDTTFESFGNGNGLDVLMDSAIAALNPSNRSRKDERLFFPLPDFTTIINSAYSNSPLHLRQGLATSLQSRFDPNNPFWQRNTGLLRSKLGDDVRASEINSIDLGPGILVCCSHEDSALGSYFQWLRMQEMTGTRLSCVVNRGVEPIAGDGRFWNWTIPGVAQPPVYTFIGLLFLFVILVGPIAYRKLTQLGRGYLMFFVAPILAAATTLILFVYGLIADGLGTQARIRQVTWLCEQDGGAVQYWRSTYFAGFRPSDGLRFPSSTRVEPYRSSEFSSWYMMNRGDESTLGTITLSDQGMNLSSGFFPSRQQRQFVAYRPLEDLGGLSLAVDDVDGVANVTNRLAFDLREVVVCDADGAHWYCETLAAGVTQPMKVMEAIEVSAKLSDLYMRQMPVAPPGIVRGGRRGRASLDLVAALSASKPFANSLAMTRASAGESQIDWWLRETLQTGSELPPLMFIAVSDVSEDCIASPGARLVESIHYVIGDVQ
ncbi:MAG TPA: hypothetical protein DDZ51_12020 [Planctomycetaceae bacterium]|nr:hypothetical protein [Planctomycetaceae bacterium]